MNDAPSFDTIEAMKGQIEAMRIQIAEMEKGIVFVRSFTAEEDARLRMLAGQGLSAIDIGSAIGRTKDSVTGRCTRLKIPLLRKTAPAKPSLPPTPPRPNPPTNRSPCWFTAEDDARLGELVGKGWATRKIADTIGRTKNSVIGRCHRLGLSSTGDVTKHRRAAPQQPRPPKPRLTRIVIQTAGLRIPERREQRAPSIPKIKAARKPTYSIVECPPEPTMARVPIVALEPGICHWPLGDPKTTDFSYCGVIASPDKPYCAHHEWLAHNEGARGLKHEAEAEA